MQHGATVIDDKMYVFGGNHNGRYLSDLQVFCSSLLVLFLLKMSEKHLVLNENFCYCFLGKNNFAWIKSGKE